MAVGEDDGAEAHGMVMENPARHGARAHPWHGVAIGAEAPAVVTAYIEIVLTDTVKYELDKASGILKVDRPQQLSNVCPALYGLIPRTYCAEQVAARCTPATGRSDIGGDGDALDLLILMDAPTFVGCLVQARLIGVIEASQTEKGETQRNDRLIGVAVKSRRHEDVRALRELPKQLVAEIEHFFVSYNAIKGKEFKPSGRFGPARAIEIVKEGVALAKRRASGS